jgi:hypothetical protein
MALPTQMIMFAANSSDWTLQQKKIQIPANISRINVSWIVIKRTVPGTVKMCAMEMRQPSFPTLNKGYLQQKKSTESFMPINLYDWASDGFFADASLSFGLNQGALFSYTYDANTHTLQVSNNNSFKTGKDSVKVWVSNPEGMSDTAYFCYESVAHEITYGDTLSSTITLAYTPDSVVIHSMPYDSTLQVNFPLVHAAPKTNTWYTLHAWLGASLQIDSFWVRLNGAPAPIDTTGLEENPIDTETVVEPGIVTSNFYNKVGGVCFRIDDHQSALKLRALNNTFAKYGQKFTLGINAGRLIGDSASVNALREIVAAGHELADHTSDHQMNFFNVTRVQDTLALQGHAGIGYYAKL